MYNQLKLCYVNICGTKTTRKMDWEFCTYYKSLRPTTTKRITYDNAHKFLVHANSTVTKETMKKSAYQISREGNMCKHCAVLKSK